MPNNRVFYACHAVSVGGGFVAGAQSVGMTTTFDLEPVFQLGQLKQIDTVTLAPQVEITLTRVLGVGGTIYSGTFEDMFEPAEETLCLSIGDDTSPLLTSASSSIYCTGAGLTGVTYNFPVDGTFTEEVTYLARGKLLSGCSVTAQEYTDDTTDVKTRQHYAGGAPAVVTAAGNLTNITISTSPGRELMYKLGEYKSFHSYPNTPAEVTVEFEVTATSTDGIEIAEVEACNSPTIPQQDISLDICGTTFTMEKCKLSNITYGGGDTGGGNSTINFTYTTYNSLEVS